ncbi:DUF4321 domain-containing protein [Ruminococcus sp.]|mgnify:CR=1 FL=1|uniref:DUF4321 domain-containing protein n=1 Tax=Ruminococcus sp. TaxID=41978 RepID=UPI002C93E4B3|nr:DUF4321 domain-containing protein [Ruminococcus sp.]HNZ98360.1 DUF4321 domain-containing protein [Ruminococcus sp.]HOH86739.1 DUF4321 domain-containing protein [Ruminococcus sp.]
MKKTLYFLLLLVCACVLGVVIANSASGSFAWLGWSRGISLSPSTFSTDIISLTFGFGLSISVAQVICIAVSIYIYIKTVGKVCADGK